MKYSYGLIALTSIALIAAPALARPAVAGGETQRLAVSYADLNLQTAEGQAVLKARLRRAAEEVCGPVPDPHDVKAVMTFEGCLKQSLDQAFAAIPAPTQTAGAVRPGG